MHNTGRVLDTWSTTEMASNVPCFGVETDAEDVADSPYGRPSNCIYVLDAPPIGVLIAWGPHHWWMADAPGRQFTKLGLAFSREDPER